MGLLDQITESCEVPKEKVTCGRAEGLKFDVEFEVWGLSLYDRSVLQEKAFDRQSNPIPTKLYPLALQLAVHEPGTGELAFDEASALLAAKRLRGPAGDKVVLAILRLAGMDEFAGEASGNGSKGDENLSTSSPINSGGDA